MSEKFTPIQEKKEAEPKGKIVSFVHYDGPYIGSFYLLEIPHDLSLSAEQEKYRAARDASPKPTKIRSNFEKTEGRTFGEWLVKKGLAKYIEEESVVEDKEDRIFYPELEGPLK